MQGCDAVPVQLGRSALVDSIRLRLLDPVLSALSADVHLELREARQDV